MLNKIRIIVPYKVDTASDGSILPLHEYKKLFPRTTKEQLVTTRNENIQLKTYNETTRTHLEICKVKIEHNNKCKICNFFVVPGNGQAFLGVPDIETLDILTINCNRIDTQEVDRADKYSQLPGFKV